MKCSVLLAALAGLVLTGCLSKVPPEQRANDGWRQRAEQTSGPMVLN